MHASLFNPFQHYKLAHPLYEMYKTDKEMEKIRKREARILNIAAELRSLTCDTETVPSSEGNKGDPSVPFYLPSHREGVNFEKLESLDVFVESQEPLKIQEPYETFKDVLSCETNTIVARHNLSKLNLHRLTAIQKSIFPNILTGESDLLVSAPTGSGKTLAYMLAIVQVLARIRENEDSFTSRTPLALIVVPTRELVLQIFQKILPLLQDTRVRALYLYGQKDMSQQVSKVKAGIDLIIATPGRLIHMVEDKTLQLSEVRYFVVDEIDKVLFPQLESNINRMPVGSKLALAVDFNQLTIDWFLKLFGKSTPELTSQPDIAVNKKLCRNMFFSATVDGRIRNEAEKYLDPNYVFMMMGENVKAASKDIKQIVMPFKNYTEKKIELIKLLKSLYIKHDKIMIFVSERIMADNLCDYLNMNAFTAVSIHGNRLQEHREMVIRDFRAGLIPLLVTTYLCSRGIDIDHLNCVVNFDFPDTISDYIHSIGRTGRMGNLGVAFSFFNTSLKQDLNLANDLVEVLSESNQDVPQFLLDIQIKTN